MKKLKIVFITEQFSENMGYIANCLPWALARLGHEVHVITSTGNVYFRVPSAYAALESFLGDPEHPSGKKVIETVTLHRMNYFLILGRIGFKGFKKLLEEIQPDIVHAADVVQPYLLQAALYSNPMKYKYFIGCHETMSSFRLAGRWNKLSFEKLLYLTFKTYPGRFISSYASMCFPATIDCKEVAVNYMGVPEKICKITPLGVDTSKFRPVTTKDDKERRKKLRIELGYEDGDLVCIYTGKFTKAKNPLILAKAIHELSIRGHQKYKGLFLGAGLQKDEILNCTNCTVIDFLPFPELPKYYQASDIGVWPTQESTSMLDAAASKLPIIVNDTVKAIERCEGNGLMYKLNNISDLVEKLLLLNDSKLREELGENGRVKMQTQFSWDKIAVERTKDYLNALGIDNIKD